MTISQEGVDVVEVLKRLKDCQIDFKLRTPTREMNINFTAKQVRYYLPIRIPKFLVRFFAGRVIKEYVDCMIDDIEV